MFRLRTLNFWTTLEEYMSSRDRIANEARQVKSNGKTVVGEAASLKAERRMVQFESTLERDFTRILEFESDVIDYKSQPVIIKYTHGGKSLSYTPDFLVTYRKGKKPELCEVKYQDMLKEKAKEFKPKFLAARKYAKEQGWTFKIVTEVEIRSVYNQNRKFLLRYKNERIDSQRLSAIYQTMEFLETCTPSELLVVATKDEEARADLIPALWYMIAHGQIGCDLHKQELTMETLIWNKVEKPSSNQT